MAPRERERALPLAVPAWAWLTGLVVLSAVVHYALARRVVAPWIMVDELIYSELAKSVAAGDGLQIRGDAVAGAYGFVYPLLLAPAWALFDAVPTAYTAAKAINAVAISLAVVPAYLLARRLVSQAGAIAVAVLTAVLPSLLYAGMLMTENAFFPLFLLAALALVCALEKPTWTRSLLLLGAIGLAFATRAQAIVFVPAVLLAPVVLAAVERRWPTPLAARRWWIAPWWRLYAALGGAAVLVLAAQLARGRAPLDLLGAYRSAEEQSYDVVEVLRWLFWHVAELDLSLGILPFAAFLLMLGLLPRLGPRERAVLVGTGVLTALMLVQVAAFASRHSLRVEERNLFYVAPFCFAALVLWVERGLPRPRVLAAVALGVAALLPAFVPFVRLIDVSAVSDTFGILAWWDVHEWGIPLERLWLAALAFGLAAGALLLFLPGRLGWLLPAVTLAFLVVVSQPVEQRIRTAAVGALFQGITTDRDWIDRTVGAEADVAALWSGRLDWLTIGENEFFNRSVGDVYYLRDPIPAGLRQSSVTHDRATGELGIDAEYVLVDEAVPVRGTEVTRDGTKGMKLVRLDPPARLAYATTGLYDDGWGADRFAYRRYDCDGGTLAVRLEQDPNLVPVPQRVTATAGSMRVATEVESATDVDETVLRVPLVADRGVCDVAFAVDPSGIPGRGDTRRLGVRVNGFRYTP